MPDRLSALVWLEQITQKCNISHGRATTDYCGTYGKHANYFISFCLRCTYASMKNNKVWKHANEFQPKGEHEVMSVCVCLMFQPLRVLLSESCTEWQCRKLRQHPGGGDWDGPSLRGGSITSASAFLSVVPQLPLFSTGWSTACKQRLTINHSWLYKHEISSVSYTSSTDMVTK